MTLLSMLVSMLLLLWWDGLSVSVEGDDGLILCDLDSELDLDLVSGRESALDSATARESNMFLRLDTFPATWSSKGRRLVLPGDDC